jgi:hypothetical protein
MSPTTTFQADHLEEVQLINVMCSSGALYFIICRAGVVVAIGYNIEGGCCSFNIRFS